ncbi:MAG TPA: hypothetical protein VFD84_05085 [Candidatus Binatia bacterium]|nr:hypothetical protein [Candidatus Binatia bacterium]
MCTGTPVAGCCLADADCADEASCTVDRCVDRACVHVAVDARCGGAGECTAPACAPDDPRAGPDGCVARARHEGEYCTEDADPCTSDVCRAGTCVHEPDESGPACPALLDPFRMALALGARAADAEPALAAQVRSDLQAAGVTLGGRLVAASTPGATRDPVVRARLALGLLHGTPAELRGFIASIAQARRRRLVGRSFAAALRREGRAMLRGTQRLRARLRRLTTRTERFAK